MKDVFSFLEVLIIKSCKFLAIVITALALLDLLKI